ncbi:MAG TPA: GntP family permease [Woeseiaceae bacterium]|nr:GntP family permease [Woeseiaceae bacterium]
MIFTVLLIAGAVVFIVLATTSLKMHPFLALILAALGFGLLSGMPGPEVIDAIAAGFGGTVGSIGIVILFGAIIGVFLERSGGALRLAESILKKTGEKHIPAAMGGVGYIVSMPVFCDTAFIILSSLNRALSKKAGVGIAAGAIALSLGLYTTHTMVPPTPGPVAAAGILGADLGLVILWGIVVSLVALVAGWVFAVKFAASVEVPDTLVATADVPAGDTNAVGVERNTPPGVFAAIVPILLPIVLILLRSIAQLPSAPFGGEALYTFLNFIGHPVIALLAGVAFAFTLPQRFTRQMLSAGGWVGEAVAAAAPIIIITAAGGAFGRVLQSAEIGTVLQPYVETLQMGVAIPFLAAAILKTAQGSSTVAIITSASLMAPFMAALGLDSDVGRALTVVAIGAGSMVVSHANDSYFWVVTQFSGMDVKTGYKLQTLGTLVAGTAAGLSVWVLSLFLIQ